jgi:hypothetical protein
MKIFAITENSKLLLVQVFLCLFAFLPCLSFAQNSSIEKEELQKIIEGKTFWFHPNSNVFNRCSRIEFYEIGQKLRFDFQTPLKFNFEYVDSDLKVKINEQINATTKIEFIEKNMFVYENDAQYLNTCFSDLSPSEHALKLLQMQKNEEERIKKNRKGGVRIGMTAKHVREKTDWGEPQTINSTITSSGRREQWVYGDGDYLYFRNGILETIQVRK